MTSNEIQAYHKDMVAKLKKPGDAILRGMSFRQADLLHMAIGLSGEVAELLSCFFAGEIKGKIDRENLVEELGDIEFYLEGIRSIVGLKRAQLDEPLFVGSPVTALIAFAGDVLDQVKKFVIYQKDLDTAALRELLAFIEGYLDVVRVEHKLTRDETLTANMDKLGKRYPNFEYTDRRAHERADKQETH